MLQEVLLLRAWKHQTLFLRDIHCANSNRISVYPIWWPFKIKYIDNAMFIYEIYHYSDVIMTLWRLKSPASRLCAQFRRKSKNTSKLRVTGFSEGNPPVTGGFLSQKRPVTWKMFPFNDVIIYEVCNVPVIKATTVGIAKLMANLTNYFKLASLLHHCPKNKYPTPPTYGIIKYL